jgi:integrase
MRHDAPIDMKNSDQTSENILASKVRKKRETRSKDDLAYWRNKVRRVLGSPFWYVELQRSGVRKKISLSTSNRAAAAYRAREIWQYVRAHGWQDYMAKHKPETQPVINPSVGAYISAVESTADLQAKTLRAYVVALRKITADIAGLSDYPNKFSGEGRDEWLRKVHNVKLSTLTPETIQAWKRSFLAHAGQDPVSQRSARTSVNSLLRCAKALFSSQITRHLSMQLPDPLPFASVQFEPRQSAKYRSTFDIQVLIESATTELATSDVEAYKIFLLATMVGLRRREIDLLEWSSFRWNDSAIRVEPTQYFSTKSEDSIGDVAVDAELLELFRGYRARASGRFVIESDEPPKPEVTYNYYRAERVFARLIAWLRAHGVDALKPLHALRKEFGSVICASYGIHAASRALRHTAVAVTDQYYTDNRKRTSIGLGHLLESSKIVEFKRDTA